MMLLAATVAQAQIKIAGNVYGGGNAGNLSGNTSVTIHAGDLNQVYGGARMANVGGSAFVNIDGAHASNYIVINKVYGGNDIAGTVGKTEIPALKYLPHSYVAVANGTTLTEGKKYYTSDTGAGEFTADGTEVADGTNYFKRVYGLTLADESGIDNTWDAAVRLTTKTTTEGSGENVTVTEAADAQKIFIGQLFGGGNGEYDYQAGTAEGTYQLVVDDETKDNLLKPDLDRTYLEICGGTIAYGYGGGNNATVKDETVVCVDNPSKVVASIKVKDGIVSAEEDATELLTTDRLRNDMGINLSISYIDSEDFQIGRLFGGNNKAEMAIMPKWNLKSGKVRNLYSGGNEGKMTSPTGLLLEIKEGSTIIVDNVYGGCRKADVEPIDVTTNRLIDHVSNLQGYNFPVDLAARVIIGGGDVNNVYGGNDVAGKVYFGNAVGIHASIRGDVYGGGNGSYPYTNNERLQGTEAYGDLYFNTEGKTAVEALEALNDFRPNAEQVSLHLLGKADKPTIIGGSVFVGGNSATLKNTKTNPMVELKIGSYVIADKVFLGNNGANMVKYDEEKKDENGNVTESEGVLRTMAKYVKEDGTLTDDASLGTKFFSWSLTEKANFDKYMEGCALDLMPSVVFDSQQKQDRNDYVPYSSYFGSFYCGGNVGSMTSAGTTTINFSHKVVIFDKLVGGCNNANVKASNYNAYYEGGLIGTNSGTAPTIDNKLVLNLSGLKIQPKRWLSTPDLRLSFPDNYLEWNTVDSREYNVETKTYKETEPVTSGPEQDSDDDDNNRRLFGGNIYGGCCQSGIVNGNVVINLDETIVERDKLFDVVESGELGEENSLYGESQTGETKYHITNRNTGVILGQQGMDVFGSALNVFGGGKGKDTEIWGSTTVNLNAGYTFQIFGGSEEGTIGKPIGTSDKSDMVYENGEYTFNGKSFEYNERYSCYVNLDGKKAGVSKAADNQSEDMADCEFMYGGGFFGPICGNTVINLGKGRIFNSFAGSCNADILGHAETYIGRQVKADFRNDFGKYIASENTYEPGFPWIRDIVYGANDLGGRIFSEASFKSRVRKANEEKYGLNVLGMVHPKDANNDGTPDVLQASAYVEYLQGRADGIFGGCYGTYDYSDPKFKRYTWTTGETPTDGSDLGDTKLDAQRKPLFYKPRLNNAFVNFRPTYYSQNNVVKKVYGAGQGESGEKERDLLQNRSYVLIDIPQIAGTSGTSGTSGASEGSGTTGTTEDSETTSENFDKYTAMEVFGAGAWGGVGMGVNLSGDNPNLDNASAIIDLVRGDIGAAYGASYAEGVTRRTVVNVPAAPAGSPAGTKGSTINIGSIFGGGYGTDTYLPCDAYEAHVEYHSGDACLVKNEKAENPLKALQKGAIFGGNNNERRTFYGKVNIDVPLRQSNIDYGMTYGNIYGAGCGGNTWSEYTEVNLNRGAVVYEVYGGGQAGKVHNAESVYKFMQTPAAAAKPTEGTYKDYSDNDWAKVWENAWKIGGGIDAPSDKEYWENNATNLANPLVREAEMDDRDFSGLTDADKKLAQNRYSANVIINEGALVRNYAYGGGYGSEAVVAGTTYVALLGGEVWKDIYAAGTSGSVEDLHNAGNYASGENTGGENTSGNNRAGFMASANVYIKGGTCRNVYGGGWRGSVGHHTGAISNVVDSDAADPDRDGEVHVVIGDPDGTSHVNGIPSITRNVYGGGEGGAIYGDTYVTINKGYIGYRYNGDLSDDTATNDFDERYVPELDDAAVGDNLLFNGGNVFGGGYVANSYVDRSHVTMMDGIVRGGLYGGGEIGPIGRGTVHKDTLALDKVTTYIKHNYDFEGCQKAAIYQGGETNVFLYGGHVMRDVFGGGRGYDNWGGDGWMTEEEEKTMDRSSKGYVFGHTNVHIHGGEIGTAEGVLQGYGNVFGGGNEGFVYSDKGEKVGSDRSDENLTNGMPNDGGGFYYLNGDKTKKLTRDCYVEIAPKCKVTASTASGKITFGSHDYSQGEYVPVEDLNQLGNWNGAASTWAKLDTRGVIIHNALFAGGNITEGSDKLFANTVTVYGNAGASLRDVFNIDLITLGTDDMGGLYGDGNLTLVNGFRELHIDNYGTDYYSLNETMEIADYEMLTERQQAYYQLKYVTATDHTYEYYECKVLHSYGGEDYKKGKKVTAATWASFPTEEQAKWVQGRKTYQKDDQIEESEYILMDEAEQAAWTLFGVTSIYAGRPMNTIQRADMCGVFGSRMVMQGAQDRVPEAVDYTNYTINRVDEVSLNKSTQSGTDHGNYFGIYNVVNYLGNLTSDVFFDDVRKTDSKITANQADGQTTYYGWKAAKPQAKNRNNGISHNMVALASGVYLEIKREEGELTGTDDWGYITGVIELDLINVMQGLGGGYVYARNEHGVKSWHQEYGKITMLDENNSARTYRRFTYENSSNGSSKNVIQTSGNFVHNTKQIVDDCYPNSGMYNPDKAAYEDSPAHYWFIRGSIYVYDQYISAFTGSANAYAEKVEMPLTIAAASNGRMTLREVQPNYYAYYDKNGNKLGSEGGDERLIISNKTYYLNDPVSYWDYRLMSEADRARFEKETYVVIEDCSVGGTPYAKGAVLTMDEYDSMKSQNNGSGPAVTYTEGDQVKTDGNFFYFFRSSNNISHDTGYLLTYEVNNPGVWNKYYTETSPASGATPEKLNSDQYNKNDATSDYTAGPTFTPKSGISSVYGQEPIKIGDIVNGTTYTKYTNTVSEKLTSANRFVAVAAGTTLTEGATYYTSATGEGEFKAIGTETATGTNYFVGQAKVTEPAYVVTKEYSVKDKNGVETQHLNPGTPIYPSKYADTTVYPEGLWATMTGGSDPVAVEAKVCKKMLEFSTTDYVYVGQLLTPTDITAMVAKVKAKHANITTDEEAEAYLNDYIDEAYYCTKDGLYGGTYFEAGKAYRAIDTWCAIPAADRANFVYNYDALDLLVDPTFCGRLQPTYDLEEHYGFKPQYDGYDPESTQEAVNAGTAAPQYTGSTPLYPAIYSKTQPIDYQAECTTAISYTDESNQTVNWSKNSAQSSWLTREQYEDIPNEKHHYSPIAVTAPGDYYMVKTAFMHGDVPYTVGQQIDSKTFESMTAQQKAYIDVVNFPASLCSEPRQGTVDGKEVTVYDEKSYFYCREPYTINEKGMGKPVKAVVANNEGRYSNGTTSAISVGDEKASGEVPAGFVIAKGEDENDANTYMSLANFQTGNFLIHGTSPTEISTLYVSNESDINDLSKEKIITVVYLYEYEESDESGLNVVPVSERHIVNIHINFKSGVPEIGEIDPPTIVLPGTTLGLNTPTVTQGAYRVTESGWEIFADGADATTHYNGQPYTNGETPVWWYQNGYYIAYYAKTRLGKTYSNSVPVSVANYHDLKKVWDDKLHHYYIDHKDVDREPKIYINDYSSTGGNGLDMFKNLIDLSHKTLTYNSETGAPMPYDTGDNTDPLNGHVPLDNTHDTKPMRGGQYLKFFLRTDLSGTSAWTPIASGTNECFSGELHGDGHTISGLPSSLFNHLCGDVDNLGVTGSFSSAGVADTGGGYVENCWINTTGTPEGVYAVFGQPTAENSTKQIVNCYYQNTKTYKTDASSHGLAIPKPDKAFYNGEVAYDLNGFYLWKRYNDVKTTSGTAYNYFAEGSDGQLELQPVKYYESDPTLCSSGYNSKKYVENRFTDGDFVYAGDDGLGTIPSTANERRYNYEENGIPKTTYLPIWPDDYIFFGQGLSYDYMDGKNGRDELIHQPLPSVIKKSASRVLLTKEGNRVYRAPAYFRSSKMGVAHFNPYAVFAQSKKGDATTLAYKDMTAIDFTGSNGDLTHTYAKGSDTSAPYANMEGGAFYPPLLDDGGLVKFYNADLTRNLLAYTMTSTTAATKTNDVVKGYLHDAAYNELNADYHTVDTWDTSSDVIRGHWVQKQDDDTFVANFDHMLVDKNDFNAPISYSFAADKRMWYQRIPENFAGQYTEKDGLGNDVVTLDSHSGWEGVSLPFKAEIVTTDVKGEITHFYQGSWVSKNSTDTKIGHEYWLREFDMTLQQTTKNNAVVPNVLTAGFNYPSSADNTKVNTNTFLWDHYYSHNDSWDQNKDIYQEKDYYHDYYKEVRSYPNYPRLSAAKPYIIGFPGRRYYEFDLSGWFEAQTAYNTAPATIPEKLKAQTITFASKPGATTIGVSDTEMTDAKTMYSATYDSKDYIFMPSYLNNPELSSGYYAFLLNSRGNSFEEDKVNTTVAKVTAFRPYFTSQAKASSARPATRSIVFSNNDTELKGIEDHGDPTDGEATGNLTVYAKKHRIIVESELKYTTDVRVTNTAGQVYDTYTLKPGETAETRVNNAGVYIVQTTDGKYTKKLAVK